MCVVESGQNEFVGVEDDISGVCLLESDLFPLEYPSHCCLLYFFCVSIDELSQFSLVLELKNLQSLAHTQLSVGFFSALGDLKSHRL